MSQLYQVHQFSSGLRLIHRQISGPVSHFGIIVNAGSRDELPHEQGLAHFIEHMIFKGTSRRNAYQVLSRLENVGADMNAFTTKEETCVYASVPSRYAGRAMEWMADILLNSQYPEKEMEKEREVIMDEINSCKENPADWIHDEFDELLFPGHALGKNILGTPAHLRKFKRSDLVRFINRQYVPGQIVLSSVGELPFTKVVRMAEKYFTLLPESNGTASRIKPPEYRPQQEVKRWGRHQAHMMLGCRAYDVHDERRIPLSLLNNYLGGPAMSSRLNLMLREKHGIAYNLESNYQPMSDTGIFSIYVGTDEKKLDKARQLIRVELNRLREQPLGSGTLHTIREQLKGQLAISMESLQNEMIMMGKSMLVYGKVDTLEEVFRKIDLVVASHIQEVASELFSEDSMSMLTFVQR